MEKAILIDALKRYSSVVIWGLKDPNTSSQRHIHRHLFTVLQKIGCRVFWYEDLSDNNALIENNSLVFSSYECCFNIQYKKDNWYATFTAPRDRIKECKNFLNLRVYGDAESRSNFEFETILWDKTTAFQKSTHLLYQSFVTDLLPEEFLPPIFSTGRYFYWIGSIWNDANNHGNKKNIKLLEAALLRHHIKFTHVENASDAENIAFVRSSRIAPSIGGDFQTKAMLPCRVWKNISYGQLGITNLSKALDVFDSHIIYDSNIDKLIDKALTIGEKEYKEMTLYQQCVVAKDHTYLNWIFNVVRALEEMGEL